MVEQSVGIIGATSFVGERLVPMMLENDWKITIFSRRPSEKLVAHDSSINWSEMRAPAQRENLITTNEKITAWFYLAPIWTLPDYFDLLNAYGAQRIIVVSSTSVFTKENSPDSSEREIARRLREGEAQLRQWAQNNGVMWTILRPTLIYGQGRDKNITEIARVIRRFGFFPLLGKGCGLRQPVYVEDVAKACLAAFLSDKTSNHAYNIAGSERLAYREMVRRVFSTMGRVPRLPQVPEWIVKLSIAIVRLLPRYRHWTVGMAERMNHDLVFDNAEAHRDFGYSPRPFELKKSDLL